MLAATFQANAFVDIATLPCDNLFRSRGLRTFQTPFFEIMRRIEEGHVFAGFLHF